MAELGVGDKLIFFLLSTTLAFWLLPTKVCLLALTAFITASLYSLHERKSYWTRKRIPSPKANLLFGHTFKLFGNDGVAQVDVDTFDQLGQTYGTNIFGKNSLNTMDLDFLRSVTVKEFPSFQNRQNFVSDTTKEVEERSLMRSVMTIKKGEEWKRIRNSVSPVFTTGKIRRLIPLLNDSVEVFCQAVDKLIGEGKEIELKDMFGRLALDVIGRAGFSLDLNLFDDILHREEDQREENPFITHAKKFFTGRIQSWRFIFMALCPYIVEGMDRLLGIDLALTPSHTFYKDFLFGLYEERKGEKGKDFNDYFQLLISVAEEGEGNRESVIAAPEDADIIHSQLVTSSKKKNHMSKMEVVAQSFILLLAGYETSGTTLQFIAYMLAAHEDIQDRLREEIEEVMGEEETVTYEHIQRMGYMHQVIQETLRMYPPAPRTNRECNSPVTIKGISLQKGDVVNVPIYSIHHNPLYYPNPSQFNPDRFSPEEKGKRDPLTFLPFGYGPRNCIGMRFAEFEIRVTLAVVVRKYRFKRGEGAPDLPLGLDSRGLLKPKEVLKVVAEKIVGNEQ